MRLWSAITFPASKTKKRQTNRTANRTPRSHDKTSLTPLTSAVQVHTSEEEEQKKKSRSIKTM